MFIQGHLEIFLMDADRSIETKKNLQDIELICQVEVQGSTILRDIHILVMKIYLTYTLKLNENVKN